MNKEFLEKLTILYVEDQEEIKNFTADILKNFVKKIFTAKNGLEGLEIFKKEQNSIDIIITDINMPKLDGLSMVSEIKSIKPKIPVVITTAHTDQEFFRKSINLDINSYTLKPIDLYDLVYNIIKSLEVTFLKNSLIELNLDLSNQNSVLELIEKQDSLIAVFDKNKLLYSNSKFKDLFKEEFSFENFIIDSTYFSKNKVPQNEVWYKYINKLKELDRISKISIDEEINTFKIDTFSLDNSDIYLLSLFNVTKLYEKSNLFDYKAHHDNVTGLYNKNKFQKLFSVETKRARRYRKELSFIIFEFSNSLYTDEVILEKLLISIAEEVNENIREHDINFRWEETSFSIMLPETDLDGALNVAYKLEEKLNEFIRKNNLNNKFYFGITSLESDDNEKNVKDKLLKALNVSKKKSENRVNYV